MKNSGYREGNRSNISVFFFREDIPLTEPDVEIEKDDYHSETRYMNSHLVHGNKAIRNN